VSGLVKLLKTVAVISGGYQRLVLRGWLLVSAASTLRLVETSIERASDDPERPAYEAPKLVTLGSLAELTLGGCSHGHHLGVAGFPFVGGPIVNCSA
jgi:hypothetical protein